MEQEKCVCPNKCGYEMLFGQCERCGCEEYNTEGCGNCDCSVDIVNHRLLQTKENCDSEEICFKIIFYKKTDPIFLHSSLMFDRGPLIILEIEDKLGQIFIHQVFKNELGEIRMRMPGNSKVLDKTFVSRGIEDNVSLANKRSYKISREPLTTIFEDNTYEKYKTETAKRAGQYTGTILKSFDDVLAGLYVVSSMFGIDADGLILKFSQIPKMVSYLRFLNVYFGEIFENFLADIGKATDPTALYYSDAEVFSDVGHRAKLSIYNRPVIFVPIYRTRSVLFLISWVFKFCGIFVLRRAKKSGQITKTIFYYIHYQRKAHFIIFGLSMLSGFHLACRTLLHMITAPSEFGLKLDKLASLLFVIFMSADFV